MATGDFLFWLLPQGSVPPTTLFATFDTIAEGSAPTAEILVLDFDGSTNEHADWSVVIPSQYAGTTGFTFKVWYAPDGSAGGTTIWEIRGLQFNDLDILTGDLGIDGLTAGTVTDTAPATPTNKLNITATFALAKADMSTPAAGDLMLFRVTRNPVSDTNTDDAQLLAILVTET